MFTQPVHSIIRSLAAAALCAAAALQIAPLAQAAEPEDTLTRLASCQESWYDMRNDAERVQRIGALLREHFEPQDRSPSWKPRRPMKWLGHEVLELTPQSVGMGLGFGVTVKARLSAVRPAFEKAVGRPVGNCDKGDGMSMCSVEIAAKRTAMMVGPADSPDRGTLLGCYYFYQQ